jgi:hypothetical protein
MIVAGITYQCGVAMPGSGPYFRYCVPAGSGAGYTMVKSTVEPTVQPPTAKSNRPCGNAIAPIGGGLAGSPLTGMKRLVVKEQVRPPPVKAAMIVPLPVADGPMKERTMLSGVTLTAVDAGPVPARFVALTEQL